VATLLLLTHPPTHVNAWHAIRLAKGFAQQQLPFRVFFYADGAYCANANAYNIDQPSLAKQWAALAIDLPVCVSSAVSRGVSDAEHKVRHTLRADTLADGFRLTGLGEMAELVANCHNVVQL
jgi:tRNA 2-thiouridine synthesizing protein D